MDGDERDKRFDDASRRDDGSKGGFTTEDADEEHGGGLDGEACGGQQQREHARELVRGEDGGAALVKVGEPAEGHGGALLDDDGGGGDEVDEDMDAVAVDDLMGVGGVADEVGEDPGSVTLQGEVGGVFPAPPAVELALLPAPEPPLFPAEAVLPPPPPPVEVILLKTEFDPLV